MAAVLRQRVDDTASQHSVSARYTSAAVCEASTLIESTSTASDPLEIDRDIRVSQRDFKLFLVALDSDEGPNDDLIQAAEHYKQKYG